MNPPSALRDQIRLPVIGAPMFLVSGPQLVVAQCAAGIIGTFPSLNARPQEQLHAWITRIEDGLVVYPGAYPDTDILYKSTPTHVDEYRVITAPRGVI